MTEITDRYRRLADGFTSRVAAVPPDDPRWESPSPCEGWSARDVVKHLIDAHDMFFGLIEHKVPAPSPVEDGPLAAWAETRDAMVAALEDPGVASTEYEGFFGVSRWDHSVDRFITGDVLIHTWDLSRGLGVDDTLPGDEVEKFRAAAEGFGDAARQPGVFGPEVAAPPDATEQEKLLAFLGRDPRA